MAGIYIHIPFCRKFCSYCNFYSVGRLSLRNNFVDALCEEIRQRREFFSRKADSTIETLYIGGGTPSVLEPQMLERIFSALCENFNMEHLQEFTIELNPNDVTLEFASFLKKLGVNRVSMGIQSFDNSHLKWMNRRHDADQAKEAFHILRTTGFSNISCDLIFGFPSLTRDSWENNIRCMLALHPEHISCYQMSVEPGTPLAASLGKVCDSCGNNVLAMPSQEECASQYSLLQKMLLQAGYQQYEISNFCLRGYHSRHNSSYWNNVPYLGLGPAAHSFSGETGSGAFREWNVPVLQRYLRRYLCGEPSPVKEREVLSEKDMFNEMIMLGLRQAKGIAFEKLKAGRYYPDIEKDVQRLLSSGALVLSDSFLRIPPEKLFVSDSIIRELFVV